MLSPAVHGANMGNDIGESVVKRVVIAALLLVAFLAPVRADLEEGLAAYDRGDYATALREFRFYASKRISLWMLIQPNLLGRPRPQVHSRGH